MPSLVFLPSLPLYSTNRFLVTRLLSSFLVSNQNPAGRAAYLASCLTATLRTLATRRGNKKKTSYCQRRSARKEEKPRFLSRVDISVFVVSPFLLNTALRFPRRTATLLHCIYPWTCPFFFSNTASLPAAARTAFV